LQDSISISNATIGITKWTMIVIVVIHWMACVWGFIHHVQIEFGVKYTWVSLLESNKEMTNSENETVSRLFKTHWELYVASLHYSLCTLNSVGYGDVVPLTDLEFATCVVFMFLSGFLWANVIGIICEIVGNLDPLLSKFRSQMDELNDMLREQNISKDLRGRLRNYLRKSQHLQRVKSEAKLMSLFSKGLQADVMNETTVKWLKCVWYFKDSGYDFLAAVAIGMVPEMLCPGESGNFISNMCVITNDGLATRGNTYLALGDIWGMDMVLENAHLRKDDEVTAVSYTEVHRLDRSDLINICSRYPRERAIIRRCTVKLTVVRGILNLAKKVRQGIVQYSSNRSFENVPSVRPASLEPESEEVRIKFEHLTSRMDMVEKAVEDIQATVLDTHRMIEKILDGQQKLFETLPAAPLRNGRELIAYTEDKVARSEARFMNVSERPLPEHEAIRWMSVSEPNSVDQRLIHLASQEPD